MRFFETVFFFPIISDRIAFPATATIFSRLLFIIVSYWSAFPFPTVGDSFFRSIIMSARAAFPSPTFVNIWPFMPIIMSVPVPLLLPGSPIFLEIHMSNSVMMSHSATKIRRQTS